MPKYRLNSWEENGYNDSDWMVAYYDSDQNSLGCQLTGTTRFAGGTGYHAPDLLMPTPEIVEKARLLLEGGLFVFLRREHYGAIMEPKSVQVGQLVRLLQYHRNQVKEFDLEPCPKCGGSGKWTNPYDAQDQRECFSCHGTGEKKSNFRKKKAEGTGRVLWQSFLSGVSGKVVWAKAFGSFYKNGYNKPDRGNTTVKFKTDTGEVVSAPLSKLRLDREPDSDELLRARARYSSYEYNFKWAVSPHGGWLDDNYALGVGSPRPEKGVAENSPF